MSLGFQVPISKLGTWAVIFGFGCSIVWLVARAGQAQQLLAAHWR